MHIKTVAKNLIPTPLRTPLRRAAKTLRYFGFNYQCPMCGSHLRKLLPFGLDFPVLKEQEIVGGGRREQAACPVCRSTDRERLVSLYLEHVLRIRSQSWRLLHVAPEAGLSRRLARLSHLDYLTADISGRNVMVKMDITAIAYAEGHFDAIVCNHVLEHIIDDRQAMRELYRVLKPGGWAVLQVPLSKRLSQTFEDPSITTEADRERVFGQKDHVRIYAADYQDRLASVGFDVHPFRWWTAGEPFGGAENRFGLLQGETLFAVQKPA